MKTWIMIVLAVFFLLFTATKSFASAPIILSFPQQQLYLDAPFTLTATMSGLTANAVYRVRIAFTKPGVTHYFGSTFNGSTWYSGLPSPINYANFLTITADATGVWSGDMQGKIESLDTNFSGESGTYDVKIGRYTQNGTSATWSSPLSVNIIAPNLTATSVPQKNPTQTTTSNVAAARLGSTTQSTTLTITPTISLSTKITTGEFYLAQENEAENYPTSHFSRESILGASISATSTSSAIPTKFQQKIKGVSEKRFPIFFVAGGIMLFMSAGGMIFLIKRKNTQE